MNKNPRLEPGDDELFKKVTEVLDIFRQKDTDAMICTSNTIIILLIVAIIMRLVQIFAMSPKQSAKFGFYLSYAIKLIDQIPSPLLPISKNSTNHLSEKFSAVTLINIEALLEPLIPG